MIDFEAGIMMGTLTGNIVKIIDFGICEINIHSSDSELVSRHSNHELIYVTSLEINDRCYESIELNISEFTRMLEGRTVNCSISGRDTSSRLIVHAKIID